MNGMGLESPGSWILLKIQKASLTHCESDSWIDDSFRKEIWTVEKSQEFWFFHPLLGVTPGSSLGKNINIGHGRRPTKNHTGDVAGNSRAFW